MPPLTHRDPTPPPRDDSPARIAAGLLAADRASLPVLIFIASAPGLIEATRPWLSDTERFLFAVVRECFVLAVIGLIGAKWVGRLRRESTPVPISSIVWSIGAGLGIWFLFSIPPLLPFLDSNEEARFLGILIAVPAVIIGWRYFFIGAPFLLGIRGGRAALTFARNLTREDPFLPARIIVPVAGIKFLLLAILHAFSPDGRLALVTYGAPIVASLAPILGCYVTLAWLINTLSERTWNELGLDPYRQARTTTIIVRGSSFVARLFSLRSGLGVTGLAILVWIGNTVRLATLPPPAEISLDTIAIAGHQVTLTLIAHDNVANFRGFRPVAFFLASERAFPIARRPDAATIVGDSRDVRLRFPHDRSDATLTVVFSTDRTNADLRRLEDVYLWYGGNRLMKLDMSGALTESPSVPEEGSQPLEASQR